MKVVIDEKLKGKELYSFLIENKSRLIAQKKALPKKCDVIGGLPAYYHIKEKAAIKTAIKDIAPDATSVRVKIVGNAAWWMDCQKDVLIQDCWSKTIKEGKGRLHLKDHTYEMDAEVGDVADIYSQDIALTDLGLAQAGSTQCLIYESDVQKSYDEKTFNKYKKGKVNQHSIGLQYVKLDLAVNDADYKEEFALWNKYIGKIINQEEAQEEGYCWIVSEIKLIEVSAVLMGANELTPTLVVGGQTQAIPEIGSDDTQDEPPQGTPAMPSAKAFNLSEAIQKTQIFKISKS